MFTGIVQGRGRIDRLQDEQGLRRLWVHFPPGFLDGIQRGASVALDGACLTVVEQDGDLARFDAIDETLRLTTLGQLQAGSEVNAERAARFGDEIGGHLLSGHIIGTARVVARREDAGNLELQLEAPAELARFLLPKGYLGLAGVSLTLGRVEGPRFSVHLIPETRRVTTLDAARPGDLLNLEVDSLTQAVVTTTERVLAARGGIG
jgi:riboflavin synthase